MKKIFIVASLAMLAASCVAPSNQTTTVVSAEANATLAYVNMDRVLAESDIFEAEGLPLQKRTEAAQRDWAQKEQKLQSEAAQLQQKYQQGLITTANAQREQQEIEGRITAYQNATRKQAAELDEESRVFTNRTQQLILDAIDVVNADKKYSMIVNAASLIDADSTLDISSVVLDEFNKLYKNEKK